MTVHRVRKAYVEEGLRAAIERQPNAGHPPRKLDGAAEAHLVAVACSPAPAGQARWTLRMLADKFVELEVVEYDQQGLRAADAKKNAIKPWLKEHWVLPNPDDPEFVCAMEDVLEVYQRPPDDNAAVGDARRG